MIKMEYICPRSEKLRLLRICSSRYDREW